MYKVFIADDEPFITDGLKHTIQWEEYGLEIIGSASDGLEALEAIENSGTDILITDIRMPEIDGLELIKLLKEKKPEIKFIVLSGYDDFEYLKESIKLGIENYLLKPVNREELLSTLISAIDKIENSLYKRIYLLEDIRIIRDNILFRWVTNSIDNNELIRRSELIQIDLDSLQYCTCIIRILHKRDEYNLGKNINCMISRSYEICRDIIEKGNGGLTFCSPDGDIIALFIERKLPLEKIFIRRVLEKCLKHINQHLELRAFICIGNIEEDYGLVHRSYTSALKLMEYSFVLSSDRILDCEDIRSFHSCSRIITNKNTDKLKELFSQNDEKGIWAWIDDVFLSMGNKKEMSLSFIHTAALEILLEMMGLVKGMLPVGSDMAQIPDSSFSDIFKLQIKDDIVKRLKDISKAFLDLINLKTGSINPLIKRVLEYISSSYREEISIKTLACKMNTNANYLGQLFKEETGRYFSDYLSLFRVNKAKELLSTTDCSISEISKSVGYPDPGYFYKVFKKYAGLSPKEFRNCQSEHPYNW